MRNADEVLRHIVLLGMLLMPVLCCTVFAQNTPSNPDMEFLYRQAVSRVVYGSTAEFEQIIEENPQLLDYIDEDGRQLIIRTVNYPEAFRFLVSKGMKLNVKDNEGNTPLHYLAPPYQRSLNIDDVMATIKLLLDAGVDINARNNDGRTALSRAASGKNTEIIDCLKHSGAEMDLLTAVEQCDAAGIETMLKKDPQATNTVDSKGVSLLHIVAGKDNPARNEAILALLKYGADVNRRDNAGRTPLSIAIEKQYDVTLTLLLDAKADPNVRNNDGETLLHQVVRDGYWKIASILIDHGADIEAKTAIGFTPDAYAVLYDKPMLSEMLREHGAKPYKMEKTQKELWKDYINNPYSDLLLKIYLAGITDNPVKELEYWYISIVFCARKTYDKSPLYVIQVFRGIRDVGHGPGCLIVFNSEGNIVKSIPGEGIETNFLMIYDGKVFSETSVYDDIVRKVKNKEFIDLPDINHDTFSDIPTSSWGLREPASSVYTTTDESIPCVFSIRKNTIERTGNESEYGEPQFYRTSETEPGISVLSQRWVRTGSNGKSVSFTKDTVRPLDLLETYVWDSARKTFVETLHTDPEGRWEVVR
jgi:ankyrin repeat protein